jgi:putative ABC transport system ATP-binding protein
VNDAIIQVENVTLSRAGQIVLSDLSLTVRRGEILVVIGPSGSGKSSLLRCLNRLEAVDSGHILLDGQDIATLPVLELRRRVGMVFQKTVVFEGTVAENIAYGPHLNGDTLSHQAVLELMELAALEAGLINQDAQHLSGGQEQRLAVARALANKPEVLLLDEATGALDPIATHKIEAALASLCKTTGLTLIWVSHLIEQARRVADRVLLLEAGRIVRLDSATAMLDTESGDVHVRAFARGIDQMKGGDG